MPNNSPAYPLLPFSRLVYEAARWLPSVYTFPFTYIWKDGAKDKERIEQAVRAALANHPVFRMRVDWRGRHYASPLRDIMHGPYHDVEITTAGADALIHMRASRILGDAKSFEILLDDIRRAYHGEPLEPDDYWEYVASYEHYKSTPHYLSSRDWLLSEFADSSVPVRPLIDRRCLTTLFPPKAGLSKAGYSDLQEKIARLADTYYLSMDGFFSLCAALAIADYCGTDEAALTWAYEGREKPTEQRIFGSLHRDVPFYIRKSLIENRESAIRQARNQIRSGIAHSDYPYTLTPPYNKRWNYAVNVLRVPDMEYEVDCAYALLDVEIHEHADNLSLWFRYSATHYRTSSIRRFAALVRQYAEWLVE